MVRLPARLGVLIGQLVHSVQSIGFRHSSVKFGSSICVSIKFSFSNRPNWFQREITLRICTKPNGVERS